MMIAPEANENCRDFLRRRGEGRAMLLLNVEIDGKATSVCENTQQNGAWLTKCGKNHKGHLADYPHVTLLPETLSLTCSDATKIAASLPVVSDALEQLCGQAISIGKVSRSDPLMPRVLEAMESVTGDIFGSLNKDLTTAIFKVRRSLRKAIPLTVGERLSPSGSELLAAFEASYSFYASLPELREFVGEKRKEGDPSDKGGRIRRWIQGRGVIALPTGERLDYVEYELKPLRVSNILNWKCPVPNADPANPRRDSLDMLMRFGKSPVFVEIKAAGDSFCSSALAQILYYGCILTSDRQRRRLTRQFPSLGHEPGWLCLIAQERDEGKEPGFKADEEQTIAFLRHPSTQRSLAGHFRGAFVIVVKADHNGDLSLARSTTVPFGA